MSDIQLTELVDIDMLQRVQESFSKMTGMAALTTDANGKAITKGSNFSDCCMEFVRKSKKGCARCEKCDKFGAEASLETGKPTTYMCHSGLIDFAAPIVVDDRLVGCLIGGQVFAEKPKKEFIRAIANDLDIDFDEYWEAIGKVPVIEHEQIDVAAEVLYTTASIMSDFAYGKYMTLQLNKEVERVANMKSDFLANMSHEIRTPMNAVIGMAEMALREELTPAAREYINQIKSSGNALLNIINDILDFSKIDSGKMDIQPVEYESVSLFYDVANIVMTRLTDKNVELLLKMDPSFPKVLLGDNLRVRQILINLANNAVKFTRQGHVDIIVGYEKIDEENILMKVSVKDTGIGIKEANLDKIFQSFQQVDSKRNRNIEGTGLGLAITRQLLTLMGGEIQVSSVYEKGSTFSFSLPQKIVDSSPCISIKNTDSVAAIGYFNRSFFARQFFEDTNSMGVYSMALTAPDYLDDLLSENDGEIRGRKLFLFMEEENYDERIEQMLNEYPYITSVLLVPFYTNKKWEKDNLKTIKKPFSTIQIATILNEEKLHINESSELFEFNFIAPEAEILVVDDNEINLTVTKGLLEPLKMQIYTATGGKSALDLISQHKFDLIFMDHMMPEIDGVETTRIIRRLHPTYDDVPIIALTANAVDGAKELFLSEGMNDFVAKPIEMKTIVSKLAKWLPENKIQKEKFTTNNKSKDDKAVELIIGDLDVNKAREMIGSDSLYRIILKEYYNAITTKSKLIRQFNESADWKSYTIEVHALKSASKQIGAMELSEMAARLEMAGNEEDIFTIRKYTDEMLQKYESYIDILKPYCEEKDETGPKPAVTNEQLLVMFEHMLTATDNLDMDEMEQVIGEMNQFSYPNSQQEYFDMLKAAVGNIDVDGCGEIIDMWKKEL